MALPGIPDIPRPFGTMFPPTWVVIDNGDLVDKQVSEQIVAYLTSKVPPVLAARREVPLGQQPDPMDLMAHGVIVVGGPVANPWLSTYSFNPGWLNKGTPEVPVWVLFKEQILGVPTYETAAPMACLITSSMGSLPWLTVMNVAGMTRESTVQAGELFCLGETKGIWINMEKQVG